MGYIWVVIFPGANVRYLLFVISRCFSPSSAFQRFDHSVIIVSYVIHLIISLQLHHVCFHITRKQKRASYLLISVSITIARSILAVTKNYLRSSITCRHSKILFTLGWSETRTFA
uniref:Uncharacterized protein n=1 Tax=Anopheles darlingi TaxID=43151 RepID=A0A2M4D1F5_ANODA